MERPRFHPDFITEDVEVKPVDAGKGSTLYGIKRLPAEIAELIPKNHALKVHSNDFEARLAQTFGPDHARMSIMEQAQELRGRQRFVHDFFSRDLPELVVQSEFLVGKDPDNHKPRIFEFHKRLKIFADACRPDVLKEQFGAFDAPTQRGLLEQLRAFARRGRELAAQRDHPEYTGKVLDLIGENNLIVTERGELKLIDTDILYDVEGDKAMADDFAEKLDLIERSADKLEALVGDTTLSAAA